MSGAIEWRRCGLTLVGHTAGQRPPTTPTRSDLTLADVARMTACPTCGATVCQPCRTVGGNTTTHRERLVPRRCACGELLEPRRTRCEACRAGARRATYWRREVRTPTAARRRSRDARSPDETAGVA